MKRWWVILLLLVSMGVDQYAAVLTVMHADVELLRAGAQNWLPLRAGAVAPFGPGDQVRTGPSGRVLLEPAPGLTVLILPDSHYTLDTLNQEAAGLTLHSRLSAGSLVQQTTTPLVDYQLALGDHRVTQPGRLFSAWTAPEPILISAEGEIMLTTPDGDLTLPAGVGWRESRPPLPLEPPLNAARLLAAEGCPAQITTLDGENLRIRTGSSTTFLIMGALPDRSFTPVMGLNESGRWARIQFLSGFGWVERLALIFSGCDDLPRLAEVVQENNPTATNTTPQERDLLLPFYGSPADNPWFYRDDFGG